MDKKMKELELRLAGLAKRVDYQGRQMQTIGIELRNLMAKLDELDLTVVRLIRGIQSSPLTVSSVKEIRDAFKEAHFRAVQELD